MEWSRSSLGAKGVIEVELTSNGEKWGRGPLKDIHSSNKARVDSPVWHLVQALNTLVTRGWERAGDRRPNEKCAPADRVREIDDRYRGEATE